MILKLLFAAIPCFTFQQAMAATTIKVRSSIITQQSFIDHEIISTHGDEIVSISSTTHNSQKAAGLSQAVRLWPRGVVYYSTVYYLSSYAQQEIQAAINQFELKTNIRFIRRTNQKNFILFKYGTDDGACYSSIGMTGSKQYVLMAKSGCGVVTMIHEIGHAVGLVHEQNRCDRDNNVSIKWNNIPQNRVSQFSKDCSVRTLTPYDYESVMHYSPYAFASDQSRPTITKINGSADGIGMKYGLSIQDIEALNKLYP